jgi:hypothetical protein
MTKKFLPKTIALIATAGSLSAVAVAWAAPDRETEIGTAKPEFSWDGGPASGALFEDAEKDETLFKLTDTGNLTITANEPGPTGEEDIDLALYKANAAGEAQGEPIATTAEGGTDETISVKNLKPGNYLLSTVAFLAVEATYKGKAKFVPTSAGATPTGTPGGGGAPEPGATATPNPQAGPDQLPDAKLGKVARTVKSKKLVGFAGTASDDKGVTRVDVAVVLKKGSKCTQLTSTGKFVKAPKCDGPTSFLAAKGTTSWKIKLPKRLKKGAYTVFARATDSAGQQQGGYTPANKKAFKVR